MNRSPRWTRPPLTKDQPGDASCDHEDPRRSGGGDAFLQYKAARQRAEQDTDIAPGGHMGNIAELQRHHDQQVRQGRAGSRR